MWIKYKSSSEEGKPCTAGHNAKRDGCIPTKKEEGSKTESSSSKIKEDSNKIRSVKKRSNDLKKSNKIKAKIKYNDRYTGSISKSDIKIWNEIAPGFTKKSIGNLIGIDIFSDKVEISIKTNSYKNTIEIYATDSEKGLTVLRDIEPNGVISNRYIEIEKSKQGMGIGSNVFVNQVSYAIKAGFKKLKCVAGRGDNKLNGYYTWPRLGYDANVDDMDDNIKKKVKDKFPESKTVQDLFKTKEGREWWKENGGTIKMEFDLTEGSLSRKILAAYLEERQNRQKRLTLMRMKKLPWKRYGIS